MSLQGISSQELDALLGKLYSNDKTARQNTVKKLAGTYPTIEDPAQQIAVVKALLKSMGDKAWSVRSAATMILPHIHEDWAAEPLVNALMEFDGTLLDSKKYFTLIGQALERVGSPALEPLAKYFLLAEPYPGRNGHRDWANDRQLVAFGFFDSLGSAPVEYFISLLPLQHHKIREYLNLHTSLQTSDKYFEFTCLSGGYKYLIHKIINIGEASVALLVKSIKIEDMPSPTSLFTPERSDLVRLGLGSVEGDKEYKEELKERDLDMFVLNALTNNLPTEERDFAGLFYDADINPAMLVLASLHLESSKQWKEALLHGLLKIGPAAREAIQRDLQGPMRTTAAELLHELDDLEKASLPEEKLIPPILKEQYVQDFYKTTWSAWSSGQLASLNEDFQQGTISGTYEDLMEMFSPGEGGALYDFFTLFRPQQGEFLVGVGEHEHVGWFILTNLRLIQKDRSDLTYHEVALFEIHKYKFNAWSGAVTVTTTSGQTIEFKKVLYAASGKYVEELAKRAKSSINPPGMKGS